MSDFANLAVLQAWNAHCFGTQSVVRRRTLNVVKCYRNKIFLNIVSLYIQCIINAFIVSVFRYQKGEHTLIQEQKFYILIILL